MKKFLQKLFDKIGRTGFLTICFLPFGAWGLYNHGVPGFFAALLGWCVGGWIYKRFIEKRFFKESRRVR
ncbi:MAG: hypothetical protein IKE46_10715 [Selenomonadaceae bacterium]|nr:hypothetical protein [Selenomonadaceae bacterium]